MRKIEKEVERETERRERKGQKDRGRENQLKKFQDTYLMWYLPIEIKQVPLICSGHGSFCGRMPQTALCAFLTQYHVSFKTF